MFASRGIFPRSRWLFYPLRLSAWPLHPREKRATLTPAPNGRHDLSATRLRPKPRETRGPLLIDSVAAQGEDTCYNLVVADFNTYFVGEAQVPVHDINLRQVTTATVPGLVDPQTE